MGKIKITQIITSDYIETFHEELDKTIRELQSEDNVDVEVHYGYAVDGRRGIYHSALLIGREKEV